MKAAYENEALGISQEDFVAPEVVNIPIDCSEIILDPTQAIEETTEEDLDDLGF